MIIDVSDGREYQVAEFWKPLRNEVGARPLSRARFSMYHELSSLIVRASVGLLLVRLLQLSHGFPKHQPLALGIQLQGHNCTNTQKK